MTIQHKKKRYDAAGFGVTTLDYIYQVDKLADFKTHSTISEFRYFGGGCVSTAMVTLRRLGKHAALISCLGDDWVGKEVLSELKKEGIDCSGIEIKKDVASAFSIIQVSKVTGERAIAFFPGASSFLKLNKKAQKIIKNSNMLLLAGNQPKEDIKAAVFAHKNNIKVMCDCHIVLDGTHELLSHIDYIITSEDFLYQFSGLKNISSALKKVQRSFNPDILITTMGNNGSVALVDGKIINEGIYDVEIKDTTGCGDVYHGAFIFGLLKNWEIPVTMKFATAVSSIKCTQFGGRPGIPDYNSTLDFLSKNGEDIYRFK